MSKEKIKIEELRLLFDRESSRKQNLENKSSYFLVIISITITIICTILNSNEYITKFNNNLGYILGIGVILSFSIIIYHYYKIFSLRNYHNPFNLDNFEELYEDFNVNNNHFENNLYNRYLTSIYINHLLTEDIISNFKRSIIGYFCFILLFILSMVIL